jgi:peptide/nickel transport system permease protein
MAVQTKVKQMSSYSVHEREWVETSIWRRRWRQFVRHRLAFTGLVTIVLLFMFASIGPLFWQVSLEEIDLLNRMSGISPEHPLGTDEHGRDVLARLMHGGRISLVVGLVAALISVGVGGVLGLVSGYAGGMLDTIIMRVTDAFMSIPLYFLLLSVLAAIGGGFVNVVIVIGLTAWMSVARIVRSEVLRIREMDYILAARALGVPRQRILYRHITPQVIGPMVVACTLNVAYAILVESALSYLGLGVQPPMPSWGNMLYNARGFVFTNPVLAVYPGVAILLTVLAFNAIGDGLSDVFDPMSLKR